MIQPATSEALRWAEPAGVAAMPQAEAVDIAVYDDLAAVEPVWRRLEAFGVRSIYQRFDWLEPWARLAGRREGVTPAIVVGTHRGEAMFLLPLGRRRHGPVRVARWLGGSHVNTNVGLYHPEFLAGLTAETSLGLTRRIVAALRPVDILSLANQPLRWQGFDNPFRHLPRQVEAQPVLVMRLAPDFDTVLGRGNGSRKRKKLRWQENALAPAGGYTFRRATTPADGAAILDAFLAQKAVQFAQQGMHNVFADPGVADFLRAAARRSGGTEPLIEFYAIEVAGEIRATFAAGVDRGRLYGYFSAITQDEFTRVSPGELLLYNLVQESCRRGLAELDLGIGEERYKHSWTTEPEPHFNVYVPATLLGRTTVTALRLWKGAEGRVRRSPRLWATVKRLRRATASTVPQPPSKP